MTRLIKVASNLKKELGKYPTTKRIIRVLTSKGWNVITTMLMFLHAWFCLHALGGTIY